MYPGPVLRRLRHFRSTWGGRGVRLRCAGVRLRGGAAARGCGCAGVRLRGGAAARGCGCAGGAPMFLVEPVRSSAVRSRRPARRETWSSVVVGTATKDQLSPAGEGRAGPRWRTVRGSLLGAGVAARGRGAVAGGAGAGLPSRPGVQPFAVAGEAGDECGVAALGSTPNSHPRGSRRGMAGGGRDENSPKRDKGYVWPRADRPGADPLADHPVSGDARAVAWCGDARAVAWCGDARAVAWCGDARAVAWCGDARAVA